EDIAFKLLFDEAVEAGWLKAVYTITNAIPYGWHGRTGYITADMIKEEIPEYMKNIFYISGPQPMVSAFEKLLSEMGIPKQQVKTDYFPGYEE
ncbi:MAG: Oxidoreductase FAD/NAD, partial [Candidatus Wolfebacteria bacterium GW2011_GWA2_47_9b]